MTTTPAATAEAPPHDLIARLVSFAEREDRAALAALRRGLGKAPGEAPEMFPYVEPWLAIDDRRRDAAYVVASLFALHNTHRDTPAGPRSRERAGLGAALREIRFREGGDEDEGVTRRFVALLDCDREALPTHLRHLVALLKARAEDTAIDYRQLWRDIQVWDATDRHVQKAWAAGFWARLDDDAKDNGGGADPAADDATPTTENEED